MTRKLRRWIGMAGILSFGLVPVAFGAQCPALLNHGFPGTCDAAQVLSFDSATTPDDKVLLKKIDEFLK